MVTVTLMNIVEQNQIPYEKLNFSDEMNSYIQKGGALLRRRNSRKKNGMPCKRKDAKARVTMTDYCYYTGIKFVDAEQEWCNPNDPRKRTLDHKIPLSICYIKGWDIDKANHPDNIVCCLRSINNIRQSTDMESFRPIAEWYREKLIEQGFDALDKDEMEWYNK